MKKILIASLIGLNSLSAFADTLASSTATAPTSTGATSLMSTSNNTSTLPTSNNMSNLAKSNAPTPASLTQFCPTIDQLVKDPQKLTWSAPGGWQSYQQSFALTIATFTGVQWAGIKVGQVICTYAAKEQDTFPIQLVYNKLILQPSGGAWGQNMGGYINCKSNNVNDCPFPVKLTQTTDVLQEASQIQPSSPSQEQAF